MNHPFNCGNTAPVDSKSKKKRHKALYDDQKEGEYKKSPKNYNDWGGDKHLEHSKSKKNRDKDGHKDRARDRDRRILRDTKREREQSNKVISSHQRQTHPNQNLVSMTPRHSLPILTKHANTNTNTIKMTDNNQKNEIIEAHMSMNNEMNTKSRRNNGSNSHKISSCFPGISTQNTPPPQMSNYQQVSKQYNIFVFV